MQTDIKFFFKKYFTGYDLVEIIDTLKIIKYYRAGTAGFMIFSGKKKLTFFLFFFKFLYI